MAIPAPNATAAPNATDFNDVNNFVFIVDASRVTDTCMERIDRWNVALNLFVAVVARLIGRVIRSTTLKTVSIANRFLPAISYPEPVKAF
jgi:hypothetical protein